LPKVLSPYPLSPQRGERVRVRGGENNFGNEYRLNPPTGAARIFRDILIKKTPLPTPKVWREIQISALSASRLIF
jgi:hypothetical protein